MSATEERPAGKSKWRGPVASPEAFEEWLKRIYSGQHPFEASREIAGPIDGHETTSRLRRYARAGLRPDATPEQRKRAEDLADAISHYDEQLDDQLESEYVRRGVDTESGSNGSSNRMLHYMTMARSRRGGRLDIFRAFLEARTRHIHEGSITHSLALDVTQYSDEELEQLGALLQKGKQTGDGPAGGSSLPVLEHSPHELGPAVDEP